MDRLKALLTWARAVLFRRAAEAEMDEELRFHLDMEVEHNLRAGMSPAEARRRARVAFGGVERHRESLREHRRLPLVETLWHDGRFALRSFRRDLGSSLVAVVVLGLGIGLPTVMYSFVDRSLHPTRRLPDGDRLVGPVRRTQYGFESLQMGIDQYSDWAARQRSFEGLAAHIEGAVNLRFGDHPVRYAGRFVTANSFDLVGGRPLLGRGFAEDDGRPGALLAVVISFRAWQDQFDGDRGVIGKHVIVNGEPAQVIGVMDARLGFPIGADVWVPLRLDPSASPPGTAESVWVFGKLAKGVSVHEASAEALILAAETSAAPPGSSPGGIADVRRLGDTPRWARMMNYSMLAMACMVLFIASANVANLLLARTVARSRDVAVRTALGASRARTIAQMMTEAGALAMLGALLGIWVAWVGMEVLTRLFTYPGLPAPIFELDWRALMFVVLMTALATLASGVLPAWRASSANVNAALKDGAGGSSSLRMGRLLRGLVISQVAMSVALLVASGLMVKRVVRSWQVELPFEASEIFTAEIPAFDGRPTDVAARRLFWDDVERQLAGIQSVTALGLTSGLPGVGGRVTPLAVEGTTYPTDLDLPLARRTVVSPGFFATFGAEPTQGRIFDRLDNGDALPVVVVNESFARLRLPNGEVLGQRIRVGAPDSEQPWRTIVGVVPDLYMAGVSNPGPDQQPALYTPLAQDDAIVLTVVATAGGSPLRIRGAVRNAVAAADAETPVYKVLTLADRIRLGNRNPFGIVFLALGMAALLMSSVGLYGVMSFGVGRRGTEMGIRLALGSRPAQLHGLVLREGMKQLAIGLGIGCVLALGSTRYFPELDQLVGDDVWDPPTYAVVLGVLTIAGLLASAIPAYRATRVDSAVALRAG